MESTTYKIYHNPNCSKSREALKILQDKGVKILIIEYLKTPLITSEIENLLSILDGPLSNAIRTKEPIFADLNVNLKDKKSLISAIVNNPILLERPIIVFGNKAVIGRPPEAILALF